MKNGKLLSIDLASQSFELQEISSSIMKKYLGGRGLGAYLYSQKVKKAKDVENSIFISLGYLTGSMFPSSSRSSFVSSSPLTGLLLSSSFGGNAGAYIRFQGINAIEIKNVSKDWVYLVVENGRVTFADARDLIGMSVYETQEILRENFTDKTVSVASIGIAGENLVKSASVFFDDRVAGRSGAGWHLGFKKIKAVVFVKPKEMLEYEDQEAFRSLVTDLNKKKLENDKNNGSNDYSTAPYMGYANEVNALPANNYRNTHVDESKVDKVCNIEYKEKIVAKEACWSCPLACTRKTKSEFNDTKVKGPEYETLWSLGANNGIYDIDIVIEANRLCDEFGMDTISVGNILGWYRECVEDGLIEDRLDTQRYLELIGMIARREGIGDVLADGVVEASKKLGVGKDKVAHSKGLELPAWDPRGALGMAVCYATGPTGGDHMKGWTVEDDLADKGKRFDVVGKVDNAIKAQNHSALVDSLGTCDFASFLYGTEVWTKCINAIEKDTITEKELQAVGERVFQLEYEINKKLGLKLADNILPARVVGYKVEIDNRDFVLTQEMFDAMMEEYYKKRGWKS